jgi:ferredoxin
VLAEVAERTSVVPADTSLTAAADSALDRARAAMDDRFDQDELRGALRSRVASDAWADASERCVACGNCTAVCPTCFCTRTDDRTDLDGVVHRTRVWDGCFGLEISRVGDSPVRSSVAARYRQWLLHKLSTWNDQFGEPGCVGCGRCVTWCPVGIDITVAAETVRRDQPRGAS